MGRYISGCNHCADTGRRAMVVAHAIKNAWGAVELSSDYSAHEHLGIVKDFLRMDDDPYLPLEFLLVDAY